MGLTTITSGPWDSVYNASDQSEAYRTKLYSAANVFKLKGTQSWTMRPPFTLAQAGGTLGTVGGRFGQCAYAQYALNGLIYRFVFVGGKVYRWDGNTTFTDVTPAGIAISATDRIYCETIGDALVVKDDTNKPWYVPSAGCGATPLVATAIQVDSVPSAWSAFGPMTIFDGRLFFVLNAVGGTTFRDTIVWSEPAAPALGYKQSGAGYANFWELFQTDTKPIYGIAGTEASLVVLRAESLLNIVGKTDATFQANATRESVEGVGTTSPASIIVNNGAVWFLDAQGRQYRYQPGGAPEPLWVQMADIVNFSLSIGLAGTQTQAATACYSPNLNLVLSASYGNGGVAGQIYAFDAATGKFYGNWDVDGGSGVHSLGVVPDANGNVSVIALGIKGGSAGTVWRQYTIGESFSYQDPSGVPVATVFTHHLGRNEEGEWIFDQLAVRLVALNAVAASRALTLNYYTPRLQVNGLSATPPQGPSQPIYGGSGGGSGQVGEVRAVYGLGPNAQGRWFLAQLLPQLVTPLTTGSGPFTITAVDLRGTLTPATPYAT